MVFIVLIFHENPKFTIVRNGVSSIRWKMLFKFGVSVHGKKKHD